MSEVDETLATVAQQWRDAVDARRPDPITLLHDRCPAPRRLDRGRALLVAAVVVCVATAAVLLGLRPEHHAAPALGPTHAISARPTIATNDVGHVPKIRRSGVLITVDPHGPCPESLGNAVDVTPTSIDTGQYLLPTVLPDIGLVCQYHGETGGTATRAPRTALQHSTSLTSAEAGALAAVISRVSTKIAKGTFHCPPDFFGTVTIIAFNYDGHAVDLWQNTSGCQTLDNGKLLASEDDNPSFDNGYFKAFDRIVNH